MRNRSLPDVPTVAEASLADVLVQSWYGIAAPAKTPAAVVAYLSEQVLRTLAQADTRSKFDAMDAEIMALPSAPFDALMDAEFKRWGELIRKRGIMLT